MLKPEVHRLTIGPSTYFVHGSNTETLKGLATQLGVKYDTLEPTMLNPSNGIVKVWGIGELSDHLEKLK